MTLYRPLAAVPQPRIEPRNPSLEEVMNKPLKLHELLPRIGDEIAENGRVADETDQFPVQNYQILKQHKLFSALVPGEFGGGDCDYPEMCRFLAALAGYHPSTALSLSMHQHIVAANRYNYLHGRPCWKRWRPTNWR